MASGDKEGGRGNKSLANAFNRAREKEEGAAEQTSNIVVGEFISELATAIRYRMKYGLSQGDWIEEPERAFTDGMIFGREEKSAAQVKLQITVSMDASSSMWINNIMRFAGPAFIALDRTIRKSIGDFPDGSVTYAPFIFHEHAFKLPAAFLNEYVGRVDWKEPERLGTAWPVFPNFECWAKAIADGEIPKYQPYSIGSGRLRSPTFPLSGTKTYIAPLFQALKTWEETHGDITATRLDIVITDGVLENAEDLQEATQIQDARNGKLRTVMLNFLPSQEWASYGVPDRCHQYAVTPETLDASIKNILHNSIEDLYS